jgi:hypothetical protein
LGCPVFFLSIGTCPVVVDTFYSLPLFGAQKGAFPPGGCHPPLIALILFAGGRVVDRRLEVGKFGLIFVAFAYFFLIAGDGFRRWV